MVPKWRFNNFLNLKNLSNLLLHMYYEILGFQIRCKKFKVYGIKEFYILTKTGRLIKIKTHCEVLLKNLLKMTCLQVLF